MATTPDPMVLDILGILDGTEYPTVDVDVFFDQRLAFEVYRAKRALDTAALRADADEYTEAEGVYHELLAKLAEQKYVFTLQAKPREFRKQVLKKVEETYPDATETNFLGQVISRPEVDELFTDLIWQGQIIKITGPDGRVRENPSLTEVQAIRAKAPDHALKTIAEGLRELDEGMASGFDDAVRSVDFLSEPSPEGEVSD